MLKNYYLRRFSCYFLKLALIIAPIKSSLSNQLTVPQRLVDPTWISLDSEPYKVGLLFSNQSYQYVISNSQGAVPTSLSAQSLNKLAWAYEASNASYMNLDNTEDLLKLRENMQDVIGKNIEIEFWVSVQDEFVELGVVGVSVYFTGGSVVLKKMTQVAKDELVEAIITSPKDSARSWARTNMLSNINRLDKLAGWLSSKNRQGRGVSSNNSLTFDEISKHYAMAVLVDTHLIPSAEFLVATQPDPSLASQIKRLLGVAGKEAIDSNSYGQLNKLVTAAIKTYDLVGAITSVYPPFKDYLNGIETAEKRWKVAATGHPGELKPKDYSQYEVWGIASIGAIGNAADTAKDSIDKHANEHHYAGTSSQPLIGEWDNLESAIEDSVNISEHRITFYQSGKRSYRYSVISEKDGVYDLSLVDLDTSKKTTKKIKLSKDGDSLQFWNAGYWSGWSNTQYIK